MSKKYYVTLFEILQPKLWLQKSIQLSCFSRNFDAVFILFTRKILPWNRIYVFQQEQRLLSNLSRPQYLVIYPLLANRLRICRARGETDSAPVRMSNDLFASHGACMICRLSYA